MVVGQGECVRENQAVQSLEIYPGPTRISIGYKGLPSGFIFDTQWDSNSKTAKSGAEMECSWEWNSKSRTGLM